MKWNNLINFKHFFCVFAAVNIIVLVLCIIILPYDFLVKHIYFFYFLFFSPLVVGFFLFFPIKRIFLLVKLYISVLYNKIILINFTGVFKIIANTLIILVMLFMLIFPQHTIIKYHIFLFICLAIAFSIWSVIFRTYLLNNDAAFRIFFIVVMFIFWGVLLFLLLYYLWLWLEPYYWKLGYLIYYNFLL